ncbi:response regulator [Paenibacillus athensensis]|uniref:AraC family transcriptional regulator n=1 Tax=Paenibacillus athensensis TaxID=1967502 RepID=A0A4Y8PZV8_9BACL|nr:helix-turn-helix domain-containing protein [Paenibacillus athensensis]MCD1259886.1 response regulator [Paenibacillus athensensis]
MYKVILVDDDVAVLEFLGKLIPWSRLGFELTGSFTNAIDALKACEGQWPELVITDIGMPGMDGLTLIRMLQERGAQSRFVILSCHDEFQYAQQAVQLGVQDYMLKETLDKTSMIGIVERAKSRVDADFRHKLEVRRLSVEALKSKAALKEKWLRELLSNPVLEESALLESLGVYGLNAGLGHLIPVVCRIHRFQAAIERYEKEENLKFVLENAAEELLSGEPDMMFISYSPQVFVLLHAFRKDLKSNPYDRLAEVCKRMQTAFAKYLKLELSVLVGLAVTSAEGLKRQLPELLEASETFFYAKAPDIHRFTGAAAPVELEDLFTPYPEFAERFNRLLLGEGGEAEAVVDALMDSFAERKYPPSDVKQFVWKLALDLQLKLRFRRQFDHEKGQQHITQTSNISELRDWLLGFMHEAVKQAELIARKSKKTEVIDAQKYVQLNLSRKITLEEVAELLHLNASYFSRLYKKETGENFIEYVTRMKMEKARELLGEPGKTVEKVAEQLGYDNKSYFVKLFKQHYGMAPSRLM